MNRIYFDISATTPIDPRVADFMHDVQKETYGNPSSIHREGQSARAVVEKARRQLAMALHCTPEEVIFTSSGSESNNMVLKGTLNSGDHFITSSYEHPAILKVLPYLKEKGIECSLIKPDENGTIQPESVEKEIRENTRLISIMHVNNELGTINPISEVASISHEKGILFHSDAVQALGKIPIDTHDIPADFISMSAHKLYGPKGVGALFIRKGATLKPLIYGGGQEHSLRASTENIAGIGGFGMATELAVMSLEENFQHISRLEIHLLSLLDEKKIDYKINGAERVPGVLNITFPQIDGQSLVMQLDMAGIGISFGAACTSGTAKASTMLLDMGLTEEDALSTVRISFGKIHSLEDVKTVVNTIYQILIQQSEEFIAHER
jgi:cysteine desulfurase